MRLVGRVYSLVLGAVILLISPILKAQSGGVSLNVTHLDPALARNIVTFDTVEVVHISSGSTSKLTAIEPGLGRTTFFTKRLKPGLYRVTKVSGKYYFHLYYTSKTELSISLENGPSFEILDNECTELGTLVVEHTEENQANSRLVPALDGTARCDEKLLISLDAAPSESLSRLRDLGSVNDFAWLGKGSEQLLTSALGRIYVRKAANEPWLAVDLPTLEHVIGGRFHTASGSYFFTTDNGGIWHTKSLVSTNWQQDQSLESNRNASFIGELPTGELWIIAAGPASNRVAVRSNTGIWKALFRVRSNPGEAIQAFDAPDGSWINHYEILRFARDGSRFQPVSKGKVLALDSYARSKREPYILTGPQRDNIKRMDSTELPKLTLRAPENAQNRGVALVGETFFLLQQDSSGLNPFAAKSLLLTSEGGRPFQKHATLPYDCALILGHLSHEMSSVVLKCRSGLVIWSKEKSLERFSPKQSR